MKTRDPAPPPTPPPVAEHERELAHRRDLAAADRADELERLNADATHRRGRADLATRTRIEDLARREREATATSNARVARLYREALAAGERTRIESAMSRSGEARALRLERLRTLNLRILVPVLVAFGVWSTAGVHDGAARVMGANSSDHVLWWVLWLLEPALLGAVAWVITARAWLASAGGQLRDSAKVIGGGCLTTSVVLCAIGALPTGDEAWDAVVVGAILASIAGPIGSAVTAHLISVVDESITAANPWTDQHGGTVDSLAEMDLRPPAIDIPGDQQDTAPPAASPEPSRLSPTDTTDAPRLALPAGQAQAISAATTPGEESPAVPSQRRARTTSRKSAAGKARRKGSTRRKSAPPDVDDLMPLGWRIAAHFEARGARLTRDVLVKAVRAEGGTLSSDRASALLARLRTEAPAEPAPDRTSVRDAAPVRQDLAASRHPMSPSGNEVAPS